MSLADQSTALSALACKATILASLHGYCRVHNDLRIGTIEMLRYYMIIPIVARGTIHNSRH